MGSASLQLVLGPLSDQIGRRPVLITGGIIFILATLGCALAQDIYTLLVLRFLQGMTVSSMMVAGYATVHECFAKEKAIQTLALMNSIAVLAPALGPLFGAIILHLMNWRWIFGLLTLWGLISVSGLFFVMPETRPAAAERLKLKKILLQFKTILSNKAFMLYALMAQSLFASMIAWLVCGSFLVIERFQLTGISFGLIQAAIFGCFILGTRLVKPLMKTKRLNFIIKLAVSFSSTAAIYALLTAFIWPDVLWNMVIAMMLLGIGAGSGLPVLNRLSIEASNEPAGAKMGIYSFLIGFSGVFARRCRQNT
jgi:DHA1 family multidrug/chloramphenicol efflux transport protein-like MFS transporter